MKTYYAVIDTNVLVSALLSRNMASPTVAILNLILDGTIMPVYNDEILSEYTEILSRGKFHFSPEQIDAALGAIGSGICTDRTTTDWVFPNKDDIVFYEVALSIEQAYLVTGNTQHFPPISKVVTPVEMLQIVHSN